MVSYSKEGHKIGVNEIRAFKKNIRTLEGRSNRRLYNNTSKYVEQIPQTQHTYGTIQDTMKILRIRNKGRHMDTPKKNTYSKPPNRTSNSTIHLTEYTNPIFDTLIMLPLSHSDVKLQQSLHLHLLPTHSTVPAAVQCTHHNVSRTQTT
jgi:hypothetical protein